MTTFSNSWQGIGPDGTTLTVANSDDGGGTAIFATTAGAFVIDDVAAILNPDMPLGLRHVPVASTIVEARWDFTATDRVFIVGYFKRTATPTANHTILQVRNATSAIADLLLATTDNGRIVPRASGVNAYHNAAANIAAGTDYRFELRIIRGTTSSDGTLEFWLYPADSGIAQASFSSSTLNTGTADLTNFRWGRPSGATTDVTEEHWKPLRAWSGVDDPAGNGFPWDTIDVLLLTTGGSNNLLLTNGNHLLLTTAVVSGDATASPATCALTVSAPAVTASAGSTASPTVTVLALAPQSVTTSAGGTATPTAAVLTVTAPAPAISAGSVVSPATAALTIAQPSVTASAGATASPAVAALVITIPQVTATGSGSATASPATAALVLSVPSPTTSAGSTASPATAAFILTVPAPSLSAGSSISPATVALILSQPQVTPGAGASRAPAVAALTLGVPPPALSTGSTATPATAALVLTVLAVTLRAGATASPATAALLLGVPQVIATGGLPDPNPALLIVFREPGLVSHTEAGVIVWRDPTEVIS